MQSRAGGMSMTWYENIINVITTLAGYVLSIFPKSPFKQYIDNIDLVINTGWLCWFFPISDILTITAVWLTAISAFYLVSIIARWVKIISD